MSLAQAMSNYDRCTYHHANNHPRDYTGNNTRDYTSADNRVDNKRYENNFTRDYTSTK